MWISSKTPKTNTPNPNPTYKPPIGNHIPEVLIIHSQNGVYDVYINDEWEMSRNHIDNILQYLSENIKTFTLIFNDLTQYKE